jgi:hypothetical protein
VWELRTSAPILDMQLFRNRRFSLPASAIAIGYFSMFGFMFLITPRHPAAAASRHHAGDL